MRKDDTWFLHGIMSFVVVDKWKQWVVTDLSEEGVSAWLDANLDSSEQGEAPHPNEESNVSSIETAVSGSHDCSLCGP